MLKTNQLLSAVTNEAYKEMIEVFDLSFIIQKRENKIWIIIRKVMIITNKICIILLMKQHKMFH